MCGDRERFDTVREICPVCGYWEYDPTENWCWECGHVKSPQGE